MKSGYGGWHYLKAIFRPELSLAETVLFASLVFLLLLGWVDLCQGREVSDVAAIQAARLHRAVLTGQARRGETP